MKSLICLNIVVS